MIVHQIEALKEAGCDEVVLAINYRPQVRAAPGTAALLRCTSPLFALRLPAAGARCRQQRRGACAACQLHAGCVLLPTRPCLPDHLTIFSITIPPSSSPPHHPPAAQVMMDFLKEWEEKLNIKITCSQARAVV